MVLPVFSIYNFPTMQPHNIERAKNSNSETKLSKFLSLVLRHEPEAAGITLDEAGWADVDALLAGCAARGKRMERVQLERIVANNDKKRFSFSEDGKRIRANQGHSVEVDLQYNAVTPPAVLYHCTASRFLPSIREKGLLKMNRHHVHLAASTKGTAEVGARHGWPVLLTIKAEAMDAAGHVFYQSDNGVWLSDAVPTEFIDFPEKASS